VLAYKTNPLEGLPDRIGWFDRTGRNLDPIGPFPFESFGGVELSPDGARLAMQSPRGDGPKSEIWLYDLIRRQPIQFTFSDGSDRAPVWSPDGQRVAFASQRREGSGLYVKSVSGERPEELLLGSDTVGWDEYSPTDWSSKGIVFARGKTQHEQDVWILPVDAADRTPYQVTREPGIEGEARISPDGRWLAYVQRDTTWSRFKLFVRSLSTPGVKWPVSAADGRFPHWSRDGKELFYVAAGPSLMSVSIESTTTSPRIGTPKVVVESPGAGPQFFGVSPDGQRFLLRVRDDRPAAASIVVVTNWPALVKRH
jgi:Tol biopolymer transport system component